MLEMWKKISTSIPDPKLSFFRSLPVAITEEVQVQSNGCLKNRTLK